jgi:hypothetical protein
MEDIVGPEGQLRSRTAYLALAGSLVLPLRAESQDVRARARGIHRRVITMDTRDDVPGNSGSHEHGVTTCSVSGARWSAWPRSSSDLALVERIQWLEMWW